MLSGNWPYVTATAHPDEMLMARLQDIDLTKSLLLQVNYVMCITLLDIIHLYNVSGLFESVMVTLYRVVCRVWPWQFCPSVHPCVIHIMLLTRLRALSECLQQPLCFSFSLPNILVEF